MATGARIQSLDALRGFALLGILLVNIQMFSGWGFIGTDGREALSWSEFDTQIHLALTILVHDKFYSLFSLLFGYSFAMLGEKKGANYHLRRMAGLIVIGLLHAVLLWPWDILLLYGVLGLLLTPFLRARAPVLASAALILLLVTAIGRWLMLTLEPAGGWSSVYVEQLQAGVPSMSGGTYPEVVAANARLFFGLVLNRLEDLQPLRVLTMFFLGAIGARLHVAEAGNPYRKALIWIGVICLPVGLLIASVERVFSFGAALPNTLFVIAETLAAPITALAYASLLILWCNHNGPVAARISSALAPAGRMALTNYLAQSLIGVVLFYEFGVGLFAEYSLAKILLWWLAIVALQLLFSYLWLSRFRQGPIEWLWRWQIQGQRPPLLK